ncbi:BCL2-associated athanogene-like proteins and related BAG family chaperone regulators [Phaffia rhodozyma]|uniref:BCL2-associated athanogene-like proteins and related BAG family chaperone regulators n=1 Tax=Phaffia rhodozyma TaxID=264483 RepID=A0A0F7SHD4_PHARH|nr:BCL2-associated athanogene-like proteins and related BAG family chaperone regulators [Phaffia rhodozyma]
MSFLDTMQRAFRSHHPSRSEESTTFVVVKWGREKLQITLPTPPSKTTLSTLRAHLAHQTHLPPKSFKIIFAGGIMSEDALSLSTYGIKHGSVLAIVGNGKNAESEVGKVQKEKGRSAGKSKKGGEESESDLVRRIKMKVGDTRDTLGNRVIDFEKASIEGPVLIPESPEHAQYSKEFTVLSEMLLQTLLWLDGIDCPSSYEEARKERKEGVKSVQGWLDRIDSANKTAKERSKSA